MEGRTDGGRALLSAGIVEQLCTTGAATVNVHGLHLRGFEITGPLDLRGLTVAVPLHFADCAFTDPLLLDGTHLPSLSIISSSLPGILANGLTVDRDLDLSASHVQGTHATTASTSKQAAIWLCESSIGGRLLCVDTVIHAPGQRAIQADRMHVAGTVRLLHDFEAHGEIRFLGVQIDHSLDLTGAHLHDPLDGLALDLANAQIGGSLFLIPTQSGRPPMIHGRLDLSAARIAGQLLFRSLQITSDQGEVSDISYSTRRRGGTAVSAPRLSVGSDVTIEADCEITGGVDLSLSEIGDLWIDGETRLIAPAATALDLSNATISGALTCRPGLDAQGTLRLTGTHIRGRLTMPGTTWHQPHGRYCIRAEAVTIDGDADLNHLTATGGAVMFRSALLGGSLNLEAAQLINPTGLTLSIHRATVRGTVRLVDGFRSTGMVLLSRATIDGALNVRDGEFDGPPASERNPAGDAIQAVALTVRGGTSLGWSRCTPRVDFTRAATTALRDDVSTWPATFVVSGFTYDRFEKVRDDAANPWDWRARIRWLESQESFDSSTYEQAANVFRRHGYTLEAERILMTQRRQAHRADRTRRRTQPLHRRVYGLLHDLWDVLLRLLVGYGYRPSRVLWILTALTVLVGASLHLPAATSVLRAADPSGTVYSVHGRLPGTTSSPPATPTPAPDACGDGAVRCFNPQFYAVDVVVPLVSLGQRSTWYPDEKQPGGTALNWWITLATLLGWLLSSIFVLSFTRLARGGP